MTVTDDETARRRARRHEEFLNRLIHLVNWSGMDAELNVPDYILANYLMSALTTFGLAVSDRDTWFGFDPAKMFTHNQERA
jgi:hypothetical protein